jgi:hypothetical protein
MFLNTLKFSFIVINLLLVVSCSSKSESSDELAKNYFYPNEPKPYVYVFQDSLNPVFEMFERIVTYQDPWGEHRLIERYNSNFMLIESYDVLVDHDYKVLNHVLYHGTKEIIAKISDSTFMPWQGKANFSSSFPGTVDSIYFTMTNKRSLQEKKGGFIWNKEQLSTRLFLDSIYTLAVDLKNQKEKILTTVAIHEFAKGLGRVRIQSTVGEYNLVLINKISEEDWQKMVTN